MFWLEAADHPHDLENSGPCRGCNHPLHQKLRVVRKLLDRKDAIVTEEKEKQQEEEKIKKAISPWGYPKWAIEKSQKANERQNQEQRKKEKE